MKKIAKSILNCALVGIIVLLLSACSLFKEPVFQKVNDVQIRNLTPSSTNLDLSIVIQNPNWYSITVKSLDVEILDKDAYKLGDIVMTQPLKINKHAADTVFFEISMDTRRVTRLLSYSSDNVQFTVKAEARAKVFGISKLVKIEQKQNLNFTRIVEDLLPSIPSDIQIPTINAAELTGKNKQKLVIKNTDTLDNKSLLPPDIFKVIKTTVTDIGIRETELTVRFQLLNPYGLAFTFRDFPSDIHINDKLAGKGKLAKPLVIDENTLSSEGELVFSLNNLNSLLLASGALIKKDLNYRVDGKLLIDGFGTHINKPFRFRGTVEIGKKDK
jgi:LEA14-like dessication related protein